MKKLTISAVVIASIGLAGCGGNGSGDRDGQGGGAVPGRPATVKLGEVTLPGTIHSYVLPDCAEHDAGTSNNTRGSGAATYMETGLKSRYDLDSASCGSAGNNQAPAVYATWRTMGPDEAQSTAAEIAGHQPIGNAFCVVNLPSALTCERVVGRVVVVADANKPLAGTSYENWREPTPAEVADVADAVMEAIS